MYSPGDTLVFVASYKGEEVDRSREISMSFNLGT